MLPPPPGGSGAPRIVAFDWQLCAHGTPARDLVDFLCFALDRNHVTTEVPLWLEGHWRALEGARGEHWPCKQWLAGFELALDDWLLRRLPLYALYHRVRPQAFLGPVVENWWAMRLASKALRQAIPLPESSSSTPQRPVPVVRTPEMEEELTLTG